MIRSLFVAVLLLCLPPAVLGQQRMTNPKASIRHIKSDFSVSDLKSSMWRRAEVLTITNYWNGLNAPRHRRTEARLLWSDSALYIRFEATQAEPLIVSDKPELAKKTMRLWDRDVCELFLAPDREHPRKYLEFEVSPTGEWIDLAIDYSGAERKTDWDFKSSMESAAKIEEGSVVMGMKIPWTAFGGKPKAGDVWLGNLFRCVGKDPDRGYLTWSPTMTENPNFHVPEKFGEFKFVK